MDIQYAYTCSKCSREWVTNEKALADLRLCDSCFYKSHDEDG